METGTKQASDLRGKRKLSLVTGLFAGAIVICTLLGNTLLSLTLPKVATAEAGTGKFVQNYRGTGVIKPAEERDLTGTAGWTVKEVLVKEGEVVREGQPLVKYDSSEAERQIADEQASLKKLELSIEMLEYDYILAAQSEDAAGKISAQAALEIAKIDIETFRQRIGYLQANLSANRTLSAPFDGIVKVVNAREGLPSTGGNPDVRIASKHDGFRMTLQVPVGFGESLAIGETVEVRLLDKESRMIQGRIAKSEDAEALDGVSGLSKEDSAETKTIPVTVSLRDKKLLGGEMAELSLVKTGSEGTLLLPSAAIRTDGEGTYVYTVEERKGPLGNAFHATRRNVKISDAHDGMTAISEGLFEREQVIVESGQPIMDGDRVRL